MTSTTPHSAVSSSLGSSAERALGALQAVSRVVVSESHRPHILADVVDALGQRLGIRSGTISVATTRGSDVVAQFGGGTAVPADHRGPVHRNSKLVSVPVVSAEEIVGSLAVEVPGDGPVDPPEAERLLAVVASMIAGELQARRLDWSRADGHAEGDHLVGASRPMAKVRQSILEVAAQDTSVLVCGESGTGKGLVAAAIHRASRRAQGPLLAIDCTALNDSGLRRERLGQLQRSLRCAGCAYGAREPSGGPSLLFDEIGGLGPRGQLALLGFLRARETRHDRIRASPASVRLISTTGRDLKLAVRRGTFRRDLCSRISVLVVVLPPLRDRLEDVSSLAEYFIRRRAARLGKAAPALSAAALDALLAHDWPENVRELENCIDYALAGGDEPVIQRSQLPVFLR